MTIFRIWELLRFRSRHLVAAVNAQSVPSTPQSDSTAVATATTATSGRSKNATARTTSHASALAIIAFAVSTAVFLTVLGGLHGFVYRASAEHTLVGAFWGDHLTSEFSPTYVILALFASLLLLVPLSTLAGSAARLVASRRDSELATLRLVGASSGQVTALTALDATMQALIGAVAGIALYFAAIPLVMLLNFQGEHFSFGDLWVGPLALIGVIVGVALLALVSALIALRGVVISPLGVSARTTPTALSKWRLWVFAAVVIIALAASQLMGAVEFSFVASMAVLLIPIVVTFFVINLLGPLAIRHSARSKLKHAHSAADVISMRRILDNPKRAWRNVSGVALAVFIAGITSIASFFGTTESPSMEANATLLMHDIGTGGMVTLFFAALLAAVSSGVMQAGNVYDQQDEYRTLILEGADAKVLSTARRHEVMRPLRTVVLISAACSMILMLPTMAQAFAQPVTLISFVAGIALCFVLVYVGSLASNHVAASLDLLSARPDD